MQVLSCLLIPNMSSSSLCDIFRKRDTVDITHPRLGYTLKNELNRESLIIKDMILVINL